LWNGTPFIRIESLVANKSVVSKLSCDSLIQNENFGAKKLFILWQLVIVTQYQNANGKTANESYSKGNKNELCIACLILMHCHWCASALEKIHKRVEKLKQKNNKL
jgi:hypothetical protein